MEKNVGSFERDIIFLFVARGGRRRLQRAFSRAKGELRATQMKTRVNSLMIHMERKREKENERCVKSRTYPWCIRGR